MKKIILLLIILLLINSATAEEKILRADFRHRPPEMSIEDNHLFGPLKDILAEAAKKMGYKVKWKSVPFPRSLKALKYGQLDVLPRTVRTTEREEFINYLGPVGYQQKNILFLVKKGQENLINSYDDLKKLRIGVKNRTAYFKRFNEDKSLKKITKKDDFNMAKMFSAGRFDTMAVLDVASIERALKNNNISNYSYANYRYEQKIGNYYGMSKKSSNASIYLQLNETLLNMVKSGRITEIYKKYGLEPPLQN